MKRYWVFAWRNYYPYGGIHDLYLMTNDIELAKSKMDQLTKDYAKDKVDHDNGDDTNDHGVVMDMENMSIVHHCLEGYHLDDFKEKLESL